MVWILFIIIGAFVNSFWVAYSKSYLKNTNPIYFSFLLRALSLIFFSVPFLINFNLQNELKFIVYSMISGILAGIALACLLTGVKFDYYSTYSFFNMSPVFIVFISIFLLKEKFHLLLIPSIILCMLGTILFYKGKFFSLWGLFSCIFISLCSLFAKMALNIGNVFDFIFFQKLSESLTLYILFILLKKTNIFNINFGETPEIKKILPPALTTGTLSAIATIFFFIGFQKLPLIFIDIIFKSSMIFAFFFSFFYLKEKKMLGYKITGSILILFGVILASLIKNIITP